MDSLKWIISISLAVFIIVFGSTVCAQLVKPIPAAPPQDHDTLYQVSTLDALAQGQFEGTEPVRTLYRHGDFGIGTFDALDGEMVMLGGEIYQIRADGKVICPEDNATTPFAIVTVFHRDVTIPISREVNFSVLSQELAQTMPSKNMIYAIRIHDTFPSVTIRSIPSQKRPYPTLAEAAKNQSVSTFRNVKGSIVGYYLPDFLKGLNMPGYHFHFISDDRTLGGHVLDLTVPEGAVAELDLTPSLETTLPNTTAFYGADLSRDMSSDLARAER